MYKVAVFMVLILFISGCYTAPIGTNGREYEVTTSNGNVLVGQVCISTFGDSAQVVTKAGSYQIPTSNITSIDMIIEQKELK